MKTPITYYGGKQKMAKKIISLIPVHRLYCEPFFGGGAVFFQKSKSYLEVINDTNDKLINFYYQVQTNYESLKKIIDLTLCSESMYLLAKDIYNNRQEGTEIEKAWALWLITNGSFAGSMHGGWKWCNGKAGSHTGRFMRNKQNQFREDLRDRLKDVQISSRDALQVISDRDTIDTVFYLDPPYPGAYQGHYRGYTHKDLYNLLQVLSTIKGKFILSSYWSQTLRYHILKFGWNYEIVKVPLKVANLGHTELQYRNEILVYNFDKDNIIQEFNFE